MPTYSLPSNAPRLANFHGAESRNFNPPRQTCTMPTWIDCCPEDDARVGNELSSLPDGKIDDVNTPAPEIIPARVVSRRPIGVGWHPSRDHPAYHARRNRSPVPRAVPFAAGLRRWPSRRGRDARRRSDPFDAANPQPPVHLDARRPRILGVAAAARSESDNPLVFRSNQDEDPSGRRLDLSAVSTAPLL